MTETTDKRKSRRKYTVGERILSLDELVKQELVIVHGKVYSRGWVCSWPIRLAEIYLRRGCFKAKATGEEIPK